MRTRLCVGLVAALIAVASCGGGDDAGPTGTTNPGGTSNPGGGTSTTNAINVRNNLFDPNATSVPVGSNGHVDLGERRRSSQRHLQRRPEVTGSEPWYVLANLQLGGNVHVHVHAARRDERYHHRALANSKGQTL